MIEHILSILIFFPLVAGVLGFMVNKESMRAYGIAVSGIEFALSLWLWYAFDGSNGGFQFTEMIALIPAFGINYQLGIDGISLFIVIMSTLDHFYRYRFIDGNAQCKEHDHHTSCSRDDYDRCFRFS